MNQFLVVLRGGPASGKTTIAKKMRNYPKKISWLKVDNFKDFFSEESSLDQQKFVDECALASLEYLLDKGFSVVMEKIFFDPYIIPLAIDSAKKRGIQSKVFQIRCPLSVLLERDRVRDGVKEGHRKPLGDEVIERLYDQLEKTFYPGAIELKTAELTAEDCVKRIEQELK